MARQMNAGNWEGEAVGAGSLHLGRQSTGHSPAELSYLVFPVALQTPDKMKLPGVLSIFAPTEIVETRYAGFLFHRITVMVSFEVGRYQFSDLIQLVRQGLFKRFHFTSIEKQDDGMWPITSWGALTEL